MHFFVSCIPDILYGFNILSKLFPTPSEYPYIFLDNLTGYLCINRDWGIRHSRRGPQSDITEPKCHPILWDKNITKHKQDIDKAEMMCFLDTKYGNGPTKRRSTTVFAFTFYVGEVAYRSKTQSINDMSSM